ncbi:MAG: endopeptidase La [Ruminococcaceae bacterium]|nr:endopeptidase La [Oscillospiraceae bacterium]
MEKNNKKTEILPVLPLKGLPVFPYMILHFDVRRDFSLKALEDAVKDNQHIFLVAQKDPMIEQPVESDMYKVGTIAKVKQVLKLPGNDVRVLIEGIKRAKIVEFKSVSPFYECEVKPLNDKREKSDEETSLYKEALMRKIKNLLGDYYMSNGKIAKESLNSYLNMTDIKQFCDVVSSNVNFTIEDKQNLLEETSLIKRLEMLVKLFDKEIRLLEIENDIDKKVKDVMDDRQKDYYLREQLKVIQTELGDKDGIEAEIGELREKLKGAPEYVMEKAEKEFSRLLKLQQASPEAAVILTYLETLSSLPWSVSTKENTSIKNAQKILEKDHYGLEKVKERILEHLSVRLLAGNLKSPIICLVGPPGVGKTSIVSSIAKALGRNYVRISLGGVRDEAEIRGHRRTYVASMPGRIINAIKQAKSNNPLVLLDEIDKMSSDYKGDPSSALLEVLDSEQNFNFTDHYIELGFDLSNVLFITTANRIDTIDKPLLDRMEVIEISGYTDEEKLHIAKGYLIPKQLKNHGLTKSNVKISDAAILDLINKYTREAGVRSLERSICKILRKAAMKVASGDAKSISVTPKNLEEYMDKKGYTKNEMNEKSEVGIATGLAWTPVGGDTLFIEVNVSDGTGKTELTGSLGDVMKESAKAAISYIRSRADEMGLDKEFYKNKDVHIHVPEGATPKDGPSAGITMATALISALTGKKVRNDVAMTGEITLRGRVLPIGGLKEKSLAAYRAGIRTIIIPSENKRDLEDIPKNIRDEINFICAKNMSDVENVALLDE